MLIQGGTYKGFNVADSGVKLGDPYYNNTTLLLNNFNASGNNSSFVVTPPGGVGQYTGSFSGTQYLSIANNAAFDMSTNDVTIEAWVYLTSAGTNPSVITIFPSTGITITGYSFGITTTGYVYLDTWVSGTEQTIIATSNVLTLNQWTHIAYTRSSGTSRLFVNGVSCTFTGSLTQAINSGGNNVTIARSLYPGYPSQLNGYVSNLRLVKGTAVYTANFTPPTTNLLPIAGTSLLTCQDSTFIDRSQNNFTITNNGTATIVNPNTVPSLTRNKTIIQGSFNPYVPTGYWSSYFPGTGSYLSVANNSVFDFGSGDFTIECWVYSSGTYTGTLFGKRANISSAYGPFQLSFNTNSTLSFLISTSGSSWALNVTSTASVQVGTWNHIAFTRSGSTFTVWLNGVSVATGTNSSALYATTDALTIGAASADGGAPATSCYVSNVRIIKGTALYTTTFTPTTTPPTAITNTSLLCLQDNRFKDNSTNNFTITVAGTTSIQRLTPFLPPPGYAQTTSGSVYYSSSSNVASSTSVTIDGDFTAECWVYPTSYPNDCYLMYIGGIGVAIMIYNSTLVCGIGGGYNGSGNGSITKNMWSHLAVSRSSGTIRLFINGVQTYSYSNSSTGTGNMVLGDGVFTRYVGYVADARVLVGTALYTSNFTPPTTPATYIANTSIIWSLGNSSIYDNTTQNNLTVVGNVQANTNVVKYGTSSMYFSGNGDYLSILNSNAFALLSNNFTIECWIYFSSVSGEKGIVSKWNASNQGYNIRYSASNGGLRSVFGGTGVDAWNTTWSPSVGVWYHLAFVRNGNSYYVFVDGTQIGSTQTFTNATTITTITDSLVIGTSQTVSSSDMNGYIDDFRITKGVARYTANFTPPQTSLPNFGAPKVDTVQYLVVAGGGGGGYSGTSFHGGGGGGAGGYRTGSLSVSSNTSYTITVGSGGAGSSSYTNGANGTNSQFGSIWSTGGGGGGYGQIGVNTQGSGGGSGGGSVRGSGPSQGNIGGYTPSEGNAGGAGSSYKVGAVGDWGAAGGGGAISVGQDGMPYNIYRSGMGGNGAISMITSSPIIYAGGGGGGGCSYNVPTPGAGGAGGGGSGGSSSVGGNGATNLGAGGGGGYTNYAGGSGGSGVVIVAYPLSYAQAVSTTGSPTYSVVAGNHVYKFTGSGTITF